MAKATGKKVLILATQRLRAVGARSSARPAQGRGRRRRRSLSPEKGEIKGWDKKDWGRAGEGRQERSDEVKADDYRRHRPARRADQSGSAARQPQGAEADQGLLQPEEGRGGRLPCALAADRDRHRQGPEDDLVPLDQDRRDQCRRRMGGFAGRRRPGRRYLAESGRSGRLSRPKSSKKWPKASHSHAVRCLILSHTQQKRRAIYPPFFVKFRPLLFYYQ